MKAKNSSFDYFTIKGIPELRLRVELLKKRLKILSGKRRVNILDIGVGPGDVTIMLVKNFKNITCVDPDKKNKKLVLDRIIRRKLALPVFISSKIEDATLPEKSFDHIILQNMLEHLSDPVGILDNLKKSLTNRGCIHISVPLSGSLHRWLGVEMGLIKKVDDLAKTDRDYEHYRVYSLPRLRKDIIKSGLKISYELPIYLKPFP